MIEINNLCKDFENRTLFENFSLKIETGQFIIFSGSSGSGKTTLLNMIGAIEKVDSGNILIDGVDITNKKNHLNYFRYKVGFLFQNFALVDNKTVKENLEFIKCGCKTDLSVEEVLSYVRLEDKLNSKVYTLSGGEQQRVALARLMLKKCDIILADEPTGSLDKVNSNNIIEILLELNKQGKTLILVTHDEEIKKLSKDVINL